MNTPNTDGLRQAIHEQATDLLNANIATIGEKVVNAENGKANFGIKVSLCLMGGKLLVQSTFAISERWKDVTEIQSLAFTDPDPAQTKLPGVDEESMTFGNVKIKRKKGAA